MATTKKITEYGALTAPASGDLLEIVDVSDTSAAPTGTNKKIAVSDLVSGGVVPDDSVTNAKLANMAQSTIKGRAAGAGTGDPTDLSATQATAILDAVVGDAGAGGTKGLVPAPGAGDAAAGKFLKADGTFAVPSGTGAETGANSDITSMDGLTGALQSPTMIDFPEAAAPATPGANKVRLYAKADGLLYSKDDAGVETVVTGGGGGAGTPGGSSGDVQYNNGGSFAGAPLVREDADTIGLYDTSNTSENPSRLNIYGLKNGATFERLSLSYNTTDDSYVFDINHSSGALRRFQMRMGGTNFWVFNTNGSIHALDASASVLVVGTGTASSPGIGFGTSASNIGFFTEAGPYLEATVNGTARTATHDFGFTLASSGRFGWTSSTLASSKTEDTALERGAAGRVDVTDGASHNLRDLKVRQHYVDATMTGAGTTGAQTINKSAGSVNFAAGANSLVVTNNLVSTSSIVIATIQTDDATATSVKAIPASGSFTLKLNANATAETTVAFLVINK